VLGGESRIAHPIELLHLALPRLNDLDEAIDIQVPLPDVLIKTQEDHYL